MEFHVGDRVRFTDKNKNPLGKTGVVAGVSPEKSLGGLQYLVYLEGVSNGDHLSYLFDEPWFPKEAKKSGIRSYFIVYEGWLELISRAEDGMEEEDEREGERENTSPVAESPDYLQRANDAPPPPPPTHDSEVHNALTQFCAAQDGVTGYPFQRAGRATARTLYADIAGVPLENDGYWRKKYQDLPGLLSPAYCALLTQMTTGEHQSSVTLRNALEDATQNAQREHEEAKTKNAAETTSEDAKTRALQRAQRKKLSTLFDRQLLTLNKRGVNDDILDKFRCMKVGVVPKALDVWERHGFTPVADLAERGIHLFLPVITEQYLDYDKLMALVRNGDGKAGYTDLDLAAITDQFEAPDDLYYIYDVEDGESSESPEAAERTFKLQKRLGLIATEVIALATHTDALSRHYVRAVGSRYKSIDKILPGNMMLLGLWFNNSDRPELYSHCASNRSYYYGLASCLR